MKKTLKGLVKEFGEERVTAFALRQIETDRANQARIAKARKANSKRHAKVQKILARMEKLARKTGNTKTLDLLRSLGIS